MDNATIEKIQKCLELARRGGTEGEANAAMARVQALLAKHNLTMAEVEDRGQTVEDYVRNDLGRLQPWQRSVWNGIASLYFCSYFSSGKNGVLIGKPSNAAIVRSMADYICKLGERLAAEGSAKSLEDLPDDLRYDAAMRSMITQFRNSFKAGFSSRIYQRCAEEIRSAKAGNMTDENTGCALVVAPLYEKTGKEIAVFLRSLGVSVRSKTQSRRISSGDGYRAGQSAGNSVSLRGNTIGGGSKRLAIG